MNERERLNLEIACLDQLVKSLSLHVDANKGFGALEKTLVTGVTFKDMVLSVVNRIGLAVSPQLVRSQLQWLQFHGCDLSRYSNPMAMIHQSLKRLAEQGRIQDLNNCTYKRSAQYEELLNATEDFRPKLGTPDPLNRRGKK